MQAFRERMQAFQESATQLRLSAEQSLGKILDKKQVGRLKQIQLQLAPEGPWIVLRDDMIEKLNLTEEQVAMLKEIRDGQRQKDRELRKANRETLDAVIKKVNPDFVGFGGGRGGNRGNRGGNGGNNDGNNGGGNNTKNAGAQNNGNQGNRPQFDPAAFQKMREEMQKTMEIPEVKAARDKQRDLEKAVENETYALISKNLYPRQRATLKSMVGPPFDRSVMGNGPGGRFGGGGAAGKAVVKTNTDDNGDEETAAPAKPKTAAKPSPAAAPRRKSLSDLRGGDDE